VDYPEFLDEHDVKNYGAELLLPTGWLRQAFFHKNDFPIGMHTHSFYEINIVVNGSGRHYIENRSCDAEIGNVFAIPPKIRHGYWSRKDLEIFHLLIPDGFFTSYAKVLANSPGSHILFEIEPQIRQNYNENIALKLSPGELKNYISVFSSLCENPANITTEIRILLLICEFSDRISTEYKLRKFSESHTDYVAIMRSIEYIRANFGEKIDVENLASAVNMSYATYLRHFKYVCHTTPLEYLTNYRISIAAQQLESTEMPISVIAQDCGFFDSSHFTRIFHKLKGRVPSEFKKNKPILQ